MYTFEIEQELKECNYCIPSYKYFNITDNSSQIVHIEYHPFDDNYSIDTSDGGHFNFKVYYQE